MEPGAITVEVSELPGTPLLLQATEVLRRWRLKKTEVLFRTAEENLGASYYGWAKVTAVTSTGELDGWSTHFSDDDIFPNTEGRDVQISKNVCFVVVAGVKGKAWGKLYLNPIHMPFFSRFLPQSSGDPQQDRRLAAILHVFSSILAAGRPRYLDGLEVTEKELSQLVRLGYLRCGKGKTPEVLEEESTVRGKSLDHTYRLHGAQITPIGETFASWYGNR